MSGLSSSTGTVTAAFDDDGTFTGNLGTAVVTVADTKTMTAAYTVLNGKTVNHDGSEDNQALVVTINNADRAADLSNITSNITDVTAQFTQNQTFTGNLNGKSATVDDGVTVTAAAADVTGDTIAAGGSGNIAVTSLEATLAANLSGLSSSTGTVTAAFDDDGTFTGNLGTAVVTVADTKTMTAAYSVLNGKTVNHDGSEDNQALVVTINNADRAADLNNITSNITDLTAQFTESQTFTGNLRSKTATVDDSVTVTAAYSVLNGQTVNHDGSEDSQALVVTINNADRAGDLSNITSNITNMTAQFTENQTFTGDLNSKSATVDDGVTVTAAAADVTGDTIAAGGSGNIAVTALDATLAADLSGLSSAAGTVTAAFDDDGTFTGNLGTAVVTVADTKTMTAAYSVLNGKTVNHDGSEDNQALVVTINNADRAADLSNITSNITDVTAQFTQNQTFTGNLNGKSATVDNGVTVTAAAADVTGDTIAAGGSGNIAVTSLEATLAANLSGLSSAAVLLPQRLMTMVPSQVTLVLRLLQLRIRRR